jgi:hypothetical protein
VPFIQITDEAHKVKLCTSPSDARIRIYYSTEALRTAAHTALQTVLNEMVEVANAAQTAIDAVTSASTAETPGRKRSLDSAVGLDRKEELQHLKNLVRHKMDTPSLELLDETDSPGAGRPGMWGIEMPERLMMEAYVMRKDIAATGKWETGRGSEPDYMDMNLHSTRKVDPEQPRCALAPSLRRGTRARTRDASSISGTADWRSAHVLSHIRSSRAPWQGGRVAV